MSVVAKFKLNSYETFVQIKYPNGNPEEVRNMKLSVVTSGSEENKKFFASTPSGNIQLSTVSPEVWEEFELNEEYYVTFTKVDKE
jgi:hypothetical protein